MKRTFFARLVTASILLAGGYSVADCVFADSAEWVRKSGSHRDAAWIESVDATGRTVDLNVRHRLYRFDVASDLVDTRTRRSIDLQVLHAGQWIRFVSLPEYGGRLKIVSVGLIPRIDQESAFDGGSGMEDEDLADGMGSVAGRGGGTPAGPPPRRLVVTPFQ